MNVQKGLDHPATSGLIRLVIVDGQLVVRKGICLLLAEVPDMIVVGEAEDTKTAVDLVARLRPDIVLMDVKIAGEGVLWALRIITARDPHVRIIALSDQGTKALMSSLRNLGAWGYLTKDFSAQDLIDGIRGVQGGGTLFDDDLPFAPRRHRPPVALRHHIVLGDQQKRVLALMTKGLTNQEIADALGCSQPTARYHVSAILRKLEVSKRSEAVAVSLRLGVLGAADF